MAIQNAPKPTSIQKPKIYSHQGCNQFSYYGDIAVTVTSEYERAWDSAGTGAQKGVGFWHPKPQWHFRPLGTVGVAAHDDDINGKLATVLVGKNIASEGQGVASPTGYERVWTDEGSGGKNKGSIWRPIAPTGYVALGDVASGGWDEPSVDKIWCMREDLVMRARLGEDKLWDGEGCGCKTRLSCWTVAHDPSAAPEDGAVPVETHAFRAAPGHDQPGGQPAHVLLLHPPHPDVGPIPQLSKSPPRVKPDSLPAEGDLADQVEVGAVTLPFVCFFGSGDPSRLAAVDRPFYTLTRSHAWKALGVWRNGTGAEARAKKRVEFGMDARRARGADLCRAAGIRVTAGSGVTLRASRARLTQLHRDASPREFYEKEREVDEPVPPHSALVLYSRHIQLRLAAADGGEEVATIDVEASDRSLYWERCDL